MYVLHYCVDNASLAVRMALEEMGLAYTDRLLDRDAGEQDSAFYRDIHPYGQVPALETPDGPVFETAAILLWLADRHGMLAPAPAGPERAAFLKWYFFVTSNLHPAVLQTLYPEKFAGSTDAEPDFIRGAVARAQQAFAALEVLATSRPSWFAAEQPSILTIYVALFHRWAQVYPAGEARHIDVSSYPALRAIAVALEGRPAALECARREGLGATIFSKPEY